jgi:hypothetical protein
MAGLIATIILLQLFHQLEDGWGQAGSNYEIMSRSVMLM